MTVAHLSSNKADFPASTCRHCQAKIVTPLYPNCTAMLRLRQTIRWLLIAAVVLPGSFFGSLLLFDRFLPGLGYDVVRFPRMEGGQPLAFQSDENRGALVQGWSSPEPWGVWSDGDRAQLGFVILSDSAENPRLRIECRAFITQRTPEQKIEFWARNTKLADVTLRNDVSAITIPLGGLRLGPGFPLILELRMQSAKSPQELALSQDSRRLAFGLVSVRFEDGRANPH